MDGLIAGYKKYSKKSLVEIFLKFDLKNRPLLMRAKCTFKSSLQPTIRIQQLVAESKDTGPTGLIRTAKYGFLTNRSALKHKIGGIYLAKFF